MSPLFGSQQTLTCKLCLRFHDQVAPDSGYLGHLSAWQQTHVYSYGSWML